MERGEKSWFETKFVNPRDIEGEPQSERLQYFRELFEAYGNHDPRFSGAALIGSTMKGYANEKSDMDVAMYYLEAPTKEWVPEQETLGIKTPGSYVYKHTYQSDFDEFLKEFDSQRRESGAKTFHIDLSAAGGDLDPNFKTTLFGRTKLTSNLMDVDPGLIIALSYPIVSTPNPHAETPLEKVLEAIKTKISKSTDHEKRNLGQDILTQYKNLLVYEFKKQSDRTHEALDQNEFFEGRTQMLKNQILRKFGLEIK